MRRLTGRWRWLVVGLALAALVLGLLTSAQPSLITLHGTVTAGVESGCVILRDDRGKSWQLAHVLPRNIELGQRVEIRAKQRDDLVSFCMQGPIVEMVEVKRV